MSKVPRQWKLKHLELDNCNSFHYQTLKAFAIHNDIRVPHHGSRSDLCNNIKELIRIRKVSGRVDGLVDKLRIDLNEKNSHVQSLESQIQDLIVRIDSMKHGSSKSKHYNSSINLLRQTITELKLTKEGKEIDEATIADLTQKNNMLEENLKEVQYEKSQGDAKIAELNQQQQLLSQHLESHKQNQQLALQKQAQDLSSEHEKQTMEYSQLLNELNDRNRVLEGEKLLFEAANLDNHKLVEERNRLQVELQQLLHSRNLQLENPRLEQSLNILTERIEQLGRTVQRAKQLEKTLQPILERFGIVINLDYTDPNYAEIATRLEEVLRSLQQNDVNSFENEKRALQSAISKLTNDDNQLQSALNDAQIKLVQNVPTLDSNNRQLTQNIQNIHLVQAELDRVREIEQESRKKIDELEQTIIQQQLEYKRSRDQYSEVETRAQQLQTVINQRDRNIIDLKHVVEQLKNVGNTSQHKIDEFEEQARQKIDALEQKIMVQKEEINQRKKEQSRISKSSRQQYDEVEKRAQQLQTIVNQRDRNIQDMKRIIQNLQSLRSSTQVASQEKIQELENNLDLSKDEHNQLKMQLTAANTSIQSLKQNLTDVQSEKQKLQSKFQKLRVAFDYVNVCLKETSRINNLLQEQHHTSQVTSNEQHELSIQNLTKQIEHEKGLSKSKNVDLNHARQQISDLESRIEQLKQSQTQYSIGHQAIDNRLAILANNFQVKEKELKETEKKLQSVERDLKQKENLLDKSIDRERILQKDLDRIQLQLQQDSQNVNKLKSDVQDELDSIKAQLEQKIKDEITWKNLADVRLQTINEREDEITRLTNDNVLVNNQIANYQTLYPRISPSTTKKQGFLASLFGSNKTNNNSPVLTAPVSRQGFSISQYEKEIRKDQEEIVRLQGELENTRLENTRLTNIEKNQADELRELNRKLVEKANDHVEQHTERIKQLEEELVLADVVRKQQLKRIDEIRQRGVNLLDYASDYLPNEAANFNKLLNGDKNVLTTLLRSRYNNARSTNTQNEPVQNAPVVQKKSKKNKNKKS